MRLVDMYNFYTHLLNIQTYGFLTSSVLSMSDDVIYTERYPDNLLARGGSLHSFKPKPEPRYCNLFFIKVTWCGGVQSSMNKIEALEAEVATLNDSNRGEGIDCT